MTSSWVRSYRGVMVATAILKRGALDTCGVIALVSTITLLVGAAVAKTVVQRAARAAGLVSSRQNVDAPAPSSERRRFGASDPQRLDPRRLSK